MSWWENAGLCHYRNVHCDGRVGGFRHISPPPLCDIPSGCYGALDGHPFFPSHVASGRCFLLAAAAGALAGVVSAFAEPGLAPPPPPPFGLTPQNSRSLTGPERRSQHRPLTSAGKSQRTKGSIDTHTPPPVTLGTPMTMTLTSAAAERRRTGQSAKPEPWPNGCHSAAGVRLCDCVVGPQSIDDPSGRTRRTGRAWPDSAHNTSLGVPTATTTTTAPVSSEQ